MRKDDIRNLSTGWEMKRLGGICEIKGRIGYRGYTKNDLVKKGQGAITLSPSNIQNNYFNTDECTYISWFKYNESPEIMVFEGDILFVKTGSTYGKVALVENLKEKATINPQFVVLKKINCLNKYLYYSLTTQEFKQQVEGIIGGTATPTLSQSNLADLMIPLPPLSEQKRIVSILDRAFAAIDKAKANTEKNLQNAKELFESYLQGIFSQHHGLNGLKDSTEKKSVQSAQSGKISDSDKWEEKKLGEVTFVKSGGTPSRHKAEYWNGDIAWYSSGELNNLYTIEPERHINQIAIENSNAKLFPKGSLLIGMYDTAALKMSILDRDAAFNQAIAGVKPNSKINLKFIRHSINAIKSDVLNLRRGVRQKNLSLEKIKNIGIYLPSLSKQQHVVNLLELLQNQILKLESNYHKKLASLDELKKSILQKAFSGELLTLKEQPV